MGKDKVAIWEEGNIEKVIFDFKAMSALPPPGRKPGWKIVKPVLPTEKPSIDVN